MRRVNIDADHIWSRHVGFAQLLHWWLQVLPRRENTLRESTRDMETNKTWRASENNEVLQC